VRRRLALAALAFALVAPAGCGGDDEPQRADTASEPPPARSEKTQSTEAEKTEPAERAPKKKRRPASPEDQPGGAGDEEPARVQALFTGRGGRITPRVVHVPPFIAVRLSLRSADGRDYGLRFPGRGSVRTGRRATTVSTTLEGLRSGVAINGLPAGSGNRVQIVADAEPGP
jgi:hypothetical protein